MSAARVQLGGESLSAGVQRKGDRVTVELDGQSFGFQVKGDGLRRTVTGEGGSWTVERHGGKVLVDGAELGLKVLGIEGGPGAAAGTGGANVRPPMTGRVESLRVKPGQAVQKGDVLFVLEAMKMLNDVRSPVAGTVTAVHVAAGATVETSQVLVEIGPLEPFRGIGGR
ncbi:MAG: pyruvate carboxylase subunit [Thermoplasmata archaeon]|jgi:biotin carboxyl carrier protein|nr:pyruvate carboxylase subunit [Thermoplasmata archaeon]